MSGYGWRAPAERLVAYPPDLFSVLLLKDQVLAPGVSNHPSRSNRYQHRQPVFQAEFDSTQPLQQLDFYRRELVETGSVAWLMAA